MEDAVDRILLAADEGEQVLVFGDRDTDGVTSTVLMVEALRDAGIEAAGRCRWTGEAYGLSLAAVEAFASKGGTLIVTVDCGISNHAEIDRAAELGIDVIVADHHKLQAGDPPPALAVLDPKLEDSGYPFRDLAGCGVVYKLASALKLARTGIYKQQIALLNVRPVNEAYAVEAVRLSNLVETGRVSETIVSRHGRPRAAPASCLFSKAGRSSCGTARCSAASSRRPSARAPRSCSTTWLRMLAITSPRRGDRAFSGSRSCPR